MLLARVVVMLAVLATLLFNGAYAWSRGATLNEQLALVLLAVIIDLAKTAFLAAAAHQKARGYSLAALMLFVLWWPAFALSTWAGYSYISTSRATTAAAKTTGSDSRVRAQARYQDARKALALITAAETFAATSACSQPRSDAARRFCAGHAAAVAELKAADAALATAPAVIANPEVTLVASLTGWPPAMVELWVAFIPALFLELVAAVGFYAVTRPAKATTPAAQQTVPRAVSEAATRSTSAATVQPTSAPPAGPVATPTAAAPRRLVVRPAAPTGGGAPSAP